MKIQCDVCNKDEASVFCLADEAALCDGCDHRVHHANKLASKHQRFSLLHPSPKEFPLCDICQEKRAFLFCQQDRAILCRDCDGPIHKSNEHTQKHNRFLLTGVKLSAKSDLYIPTSNTAAAAALTNGCDSVPDCKSQPVSTKKPPPGFSDTSQIYHPPLIEKTSTAATVTTVTNKDNNNNNPLTTDHFGSTSSISEYLIEMLPGWHVEDILDSSSTASPSSFGLCKANNGVITDFESELSSFSSESMGIWVPQAPSQLAQPSHYSSHINGQIGFKENNEATSLKASRRWCDDGFTVPQISPPSNGSKTSRSSW